MRQQTGSFRGALAVATTIHGCTTLCIEPGSFRGAAVATDTRLYYALYRARGRFVVLSSYNDTRLYYALYRAGVVRGAGVVHDTAVLCRGVFCTGSSYNDTPLYYALYRARGRFVVHWQ
ncbi:hypothetical protein J6590_013584 [Homalodisca vitripennis]|nr:hypothetical protein J6590_013584 [Homalodisca vitripennis]